MICLFQRQVQALSAISSGKAALRMIGGRPAAGEVDLNKKVNPLAPHLFQKLNTVPKPDNLQHKIRQHVNPLSDRHQLPLSLPADWISSKFSNPSNPFVIDIGCSKGSWAMQYAVDHPDRNVIGIDIREPMIELANARVERLGVSNIFYIFTNANVNISRLLKDISEVSTVELIAIQFPDPYFKKRQFKRRLVDDMFVKTLAFGLPAGAGCKIFFQSDVKDLCDLAVNKFSAVPWFTPCAYHDLCKLLENANPTGVMTEREISVLKRKLDVYRISFMRTDIPFYGDLKERDNTSEEDDVDTSDEEGEEENVEK